MKYGHPESPEGQQAEQVKRDQVIAIERRRWWELAETYRRCVQIARDQWATQLNLAAAEQEQLAIEMRDRTAKGMRATGKEYDADRHIPTPLLTPRDGLQFLKEVAATLLISADRQNLPVTKAGRRETQSDEAAQVVDEALEVEAGALAEAGETPASESERLAVSEAPAP